ncbi:protein saal1 isoform X4 [Prunus dulcis]|uniref:protein saal1 isoform X4 n=1 Tax=Prunus dulcis TaxID=3755 RepID=UPI001482C67C|nr:protein saal1 isoform X4 [Prunus dulcis]
MAVDAKSVPLEDQEEQERQVQRHDAPAHNPSAPPDEFFDISTTVDPSYVISLIRKLLPANASNNHNSHGDVFFAHVQELDTDHTVKTAPTLHVSNDGSESMEIADDFHKSAPEERQNNGSYDGAEQCGHSVPVGEEAWEEYGCILWDLAASKTHAELMVQNLILEVLLANLMVSQSARATEITLGIIGNLACHEVPMKHIVSTSGLIGTVVDQLFSEYAQCLCEACRLLTVGLQSSERISWAKELQSEHILSRILWIAENSLNPQLIEKSVELLLATIESSEEVVLILLPPLMKLGLASLLINLLDFEMSQLLSERVPERYPVLDVILRSIEALSVIDGHSQEICSNKDLFRLVCELVKLPDKVEGLLDIFPFSSEDLEARSALWNIIARLLVRVQENEMSRSALQQYVSVLVSKSDVIEDDLLDSQLDELNSKARTTSLRRIICLLNQWTASKDDHKENEMMGNRHEDDINIDRLLDCCCKHSEPILIHCFCSLHKA